MIFGQPAWVDTILDRMQTTLASKTTVPGDLIFVYEGEPLDLLRHPPGDWFVALAPLSLPVMPGYPAGGGGSHTLFDGRVRTDVFRRVGGDQEFRSRRVFKGNAASLSTMVKMVADALQLETLPASVMIPPTTPLVEPMRLISAEFNPRTPPTGWGWCRLTWSTKFRSSMGVAE